LVNEKDVDVEYCLFHKGSSNLPRFISSDRVNIIHISYTYSYIYPVLVIKYYHLKVRKIHQYQVDNILAGLTCQYIFL